MVSSSRGLCGGYNSNVLRTALGFIDERKRAGQSTEATVFGKKGISYFRFLRQAFSEATTEVGDAPRFEQIEPIANELIQRFLDGEISAVYVSYMRFYSAGKQRPETIQLLPLAPSAPADGVKAKAVDYEFRPEPGALLDDLLPAVARIRLFQSFLDAAVSEQIARMVAMKAATEASEEMIKNLSRQYNRARQTQITMELLDIVGGANALA